MIKPYTSAPIPFQGQKRYWNKHLVELAKSIPYGATVLDCFGGSGLCSHILKYERPDLRVIWNDYDDYQRMLDLIPQTNKYLEEMGAILAQFELNQHIEVGTPSHDALRRILSQCKAEGGDYQTLRRVLSFSSSDTRKDDIKFYVGQRGIKAYDATGYLEGVERVQMDWRELVASFPEDAILVLDPPYLSTDASRYGAKQDGVYFGLADHLDVMGALRGRQYIFFTSNKSESLELEEKVRQIFGVSFFGEGVRILHRSVSLSGKGNGYTDILATNLPEAPALPL